MTDEKKKNKKSGKPTKSKTDEKQHTDEDTQKMSSSRLQSARSSKSAQLMLRVLSSRPSQSKTSNIDEYAAESHADSSSEQAATNALSVTARWSQSRRSSNTFTHNPAVTSNQMTESNVNQMSGNQVVNEQVANKLATENMLKNHGQKDKKNDRTDKLCESLDANVLRDVLMCQDDTRNNIENESRRSAFSPLTAAASDRDLSHTVPDVPPLSLQSNFGSRRSSLKLVMFNLTSALLHIQIMCTLLSVKVLHK